MFENIEQFKNRIALITERDGAITYGEFVNFSDRIGRSVTSRNLVFFVCSNQIESVAAYVGFLRNKVVPLLLPSSINASTLSFLESNYKPAFIWAPLLIQQELGQREIVFKEGGYGLFSCHLDGLPILHPDLGLLMTTSGSTGSPKMVRLSFKNLSSNADSIAKGLELTSLDVPITTLPMNYVYGLSIINSHLSIGGTVILNNYSVIDRKFWNLLKSKRATTFGGIPYTYEMIKRLGFNFLKNTSIDTLTQAGGSLNSDMVSELGRLSGSLCKRFFVMYGQTEATSRMAILPSAYAQLKPKSIGFAISGGRLEIEEIEQNPTDGGESFRIGELVYRGPNVCLGYAFSNRDLFKGDENFGILRTGDLAHFDEEGFCYIVGRVKRFIKIYGNRISLDDVERFISAQGFESVCAGQDNHLKMYVTSPDNHDQLIVKVASYLNINRLALSVIYIDKIPRSEYGKVFYADLDGRKQ
jgi:acyl-coenzyme A synthetase/AMP-(fatty) acid ligase